MPSRRVLSIWLGRVACVVATLCKSRTRVGSARLANHSA
jgi:hypothetical protein